jgi:hypothetical protein
MDGETIRLVATAAGAVIAGLGGAWMAGRYNSKNTRATIEAARVQAELDRDQEHTRWLRDRKVRCYADFLGQARDVGLALATLHKEDASKTRQLKEIAVISDELLIIAPRHIYDQAMKVMTSVSAIVHASMPNPDRTARDAAYDAAHRGFVGEYMGLERLIRKDLGVESPVEEIP